MVQRIQTLLLLLATATIALTFIFPIANLTSTDGLVKAMYTNFGIVTLDTKGKLASMGDGYIYIVAAAIILFLLFAISQFKKRVLQMKICRLSYILILAHFAMCFFMPDSAAASIKYMNEVKVVGYGISFYLPIAALVFTFLAERFIKRDENLVKSADRLR